MQGGRSLTRGLAALSVLAAGCSLFVPDDDEYVGGSGPDAGASGGSAGLAVFGGSSGAGGSAGSGGSGGSGGNGGSSGSVSGGGSGGSTGGAGGAGGSSGSAGSANGGSGGNAGSGGNGGSGGASCVPGQHTLTPQPTGIYVVLDRTTSMGGAAWNDAEDGITDFVAGSPGADWMGLMYFPPKSGLGLCNGSGYTTPAVAIGQLPANASAIAQSLSSTGIGGGTSQLVGAMEGATSYSVGYAAAHPDLQLNIALLTDHSGFDTCGSISMVASIVNAAAEADPPVRAFVLAFDAVGGGGSNLDSVAQAGGSEQAIEVNTEQDVEAGLARAAVACRFSLPSTGTPGSATLGPLPLTQVASAQSCQAGNQFFLSGTPPTALVLCPDPCNSLSAIGNASVQMNVTCP